MICAVDVDEEADRQQRDDDGEQQMNLLVIVLRQILSLSCREAQSIRVVVDGSISIHLHEHRPSFSGVTMAALR